ncbi:MAG: lysophospholipid acyltransferase family protein [Cellvibrionaceae bacterium]
MSKKNSSEKRQIRKQRRGKIGAAFLKGMGYLPLKLNRNVGVLLGHCIWMAKADAVKIAKENIARCFPEKTHKEQRSLAKQCIIETAKTAAEAPSIWRQSLNNYRDLILQVEGQELLVTNENDRRGVLLLAPHLGNWEMMGPYVAELNDATYMYQPSGVDALDEIIVQGRAKNGATLAPTNRKGVKMLLDRLNSGGLVTILPDQVPDDNGGEIAPFFGVPALTMTLVHKLIRRTQCRVVIGFAKRIPGGFHFIYKEVDPAISGEDTGKSLETMNKAIEALVMLAPEQYQWEYKRFKKISG